MTVWLPLSFPLHRSAFLLFLSFPTSASPTIPLNMKQSFYICVFLILCQKHQKREQAQQKRRSYLVRFFTQKKPEIYSIKKRINSIQILYFAGVPFFWKIVSFQSFRQKKIINKTYVILFIVLIEFQKLPPEKVK